MINFQIARLTNNNSKGNLPVYLQPHARKLRRSSLSKNVDKLTVRTFASGQRSGRRRRAIMKEPPGKSPTNRRRHTKARHAREQTILEETSSVSTQDTIISDIGNPIPKLCIENTDYNKRKGELDHAIVSKRPRSNTEYHASYGKQQVGN